MIQNQYPDVCVHPLVLRSPSPDLIYAAAAGSVTVKPGFNDLNNYKIPGYESSDKQEKREGKRDKTKKIPEGSEGDCNPGGDNEDTADDKEPAGPAFIERDPRSPDGENDEGLGAERFKEPDRPEQLHGCMKHQKERYEGEDIEQ